MLKRLNELYTKLEITTDPVEREKLQRQIQYLEIVIKRELKNYIDKMPMSEIEKLNRAYNLSEYNTMDEIKKALFAKLNIHTADNAAKYKQRIVISKLVVELAKKHNITMEKEQEFNETLLNLLKKINAHNLRNIAGYRQYEELDYITASIWWNEFYQHNKADKEFTSRIKEEYSEKVVSAEGKAYESLVNFFKDKLTSFELELLIMLIAQKALRPDFAMPNGGLTLRFQDLNFYDQYINPNEQVKVDTQDIKDGLEGISNVPKR